jgi:hemerythrin
MKLTWTDDLKLGNEVMDRDHCDLFAILDRFEGADEGGFLALFGELVHHLEEHFSREDELMQKYGFFAYSCHHGEHQSVLEQLRLLEKQAKAGNFQGARQFVDTGVIPWFMNHRNTMDFVTADFLRQAMAG